MEGELGDAVVLCLVRSCRWIYADIGFHERTVYRVVDINLGDVEVDL